MDSRARFIELANDRSQHMQIALSLLRNRAEAEDAIQRALLKAWVRLDQCRQETMGGWLRTILVNECRMARRRQVIRREADDVTIADVNPHAREPNPEQLVVEAERAGILAREVRRLPKRYQQAIVTRVRFAGHYSGNIHAAMALRLTLPAYKDRLFQARVALKARLGRRAA